MFAMTDVLHFVPFAGPVWSVAFLALLLAARASKWLRGMIRKLKSGVYRLYSRKINPKTGRRRNLGTFDTLEQAKKHEQAVQFFKRR